MKHRRAAWLVILACMLGGYGKACAKGVDFGKIESPIVFRGDEKFAYRDPAVVYDKGHFHLYFTISENAADGGYYNYLAYSRSSDLIHWTYPRILTPRDRKLNFSSPGNVIRRQGEWILCLQTYPTPNKEKYGTK
ncbi:MAG: sialidase family protein, partial [Planctomycetia bacterium]